MPQKPVRRLPTVITDFCRIVRCEGNPMIALHAGVTDYDMRIIEANQPYRRCAAHCRQTRARDGLTLALNEHPTLNAKPM
jgi:hypothetical protein